MAFPNTYDVFDDIPLTTYNDLVEGEMTDINNKLDTMPTEMKNAVVDAMLGKMEIHDDVMDIYDVSGNIIRTFNLFDAEGHPTTNSAVYKREIKI